MCTRITRASYYNAESDSVGLGGAWNPSLTRPQVMQMVLTQDHKLLKNSRFFYQAGFILTKKRIRLGNITVNISETDKTRTEGKMLELSALLV